VSRAGLNAERQNLKPIPTPEPRRCTSRLPSVRRMPSSGMLHSVVLVRTDVSEELSASFIRVTRIGELGTMLAVTSNRRRLNFFVPPKCMFLQEPHGVTSQKTAFCSHRCENLKSYITSVTSPHITDLHYESCCCKPHKFPRPAIDGRGTGQDPPPVVRLLPPTRKTWQSSPCAILIKYHDMKT
jgi:hypothetical protein